MAARFFLSDMRNRQFKASGAFAIPLNLTMLGLAEDKLSLDGFMELFSQIQGITIARLIKNTTRLTVFRYSWGVNLSVYQRR